LEGSWNSKALQTTRIMGAKVSDFKKMAGYDLIVFSGHGTTVTCEIEEEPYFGEYPVWTTSETSSTLNIESLNKDLQKELQSNNIGRIWRKEANTFYFFIFPKAITEWYGDNELEGSIIFSEACEFMGADDSLSAPGEVREEFPNAFLGRGAEAVMGFYNTANAEYGRDFMSTVADGLIAGNTAKTAYTTAINTHGTNDSSYRSSEDSTRAYAHFRENQNKGKYNSIVKDSKTDLPLAGVTVKAICKANRKTYEITTDATGIVNFQLIEGLYTIEYSKEGYGTLSSDVNITRGETPAVLTTIFMSWIGGPRGMIVGTVVEQGTNAPLSGVLVEASIAGTSQVVARTTTGSGGLYTLSVDIDNAYNLKFTKSGYVELTRENVGGIDPFEVLLDVAMVPSGGGGGDTPQTWDFIVPVVHQTTPPAGYTSISTAQQLNDVRNNLSGKYILMGDIDLASWGNWVPIGTFKGEFDGNGYVIKNMTISSTYNGLFASTNQCKIRNLGIVGAALSGGSNSGGISAYDRNSTISNCYFSGSISTSAFRAGGIVADTEGSTIVHCFNLGYVSGSPSGGIAGTSSSTIEKCFNTGNVIGAVSVGGIVGGAGSSSVISNCFNVGNVSFVVVRWQGAGGIVGAASGTIDRCYNTGNVSGTLSSSEFGGGIAGTANLPVAISNSYYLDNVDLAVYDETNGGTLGIVKQ